MPFHRQTAHSAHRTNDCPWHNRHNRSASGSLWPPPTSSHRRLKWYALKGKHLIKWILFTASSRSLLSEIGILRQICKCMAVPYTRAATIWGRCSGWCKRSKKRQPSCLCSTIAGVHTLKMQTTFRAPAWLSQLSFVLWLRFWAQGPGFESYVRVPTLCFSLCLSWTNK